MRRRATRGVAVATLLALTGTLLAVSGAPAPASPAVLPMHEGAHAEGQGASAATLPTGFTDMKLRAIYRKG